MRASFSPLILRKTQRTHPSRKALGCVDRLCSYKLTGSSFVRGYQMKYSTKFLSYHFSNKVKSHFIHSLAGASPREMAELEGRMWSAVGSKVQDPEVETDLTSLEWMQRRLAVSEDGTVQILLRLPTLLHPKLDELKILVKNAAEDEIMKWATEKGYELKVNAEVSAVPSKPFPWMVKAEGDYKDVVSELGPGLSNVAHFVAVYSCKGGVGKSTVAANLAFELARMGGRIGLLDVDVHGPSLPVLVRPDDPAVRRSPLGKGMVYPITHHGVKMMSLGYVSSKSGVPGSGSDSGATVVKGPMAVKVVAQLLKGTDWGDLDVLVLDLPPGTGDVQLSICQDLHLSGAVAVTTPSKLAITDARKGIEMFASLDIPTIALVENMAYFECEGGGKHFPFGKGFQEFLNDKKQVLDVKESNVCQLPISTLANDANDSGSPLCLSRPEDAIKELTAFKQLAISVSRELFLLQHGGVKHQQLVVFEGNLNKFDISTIQLTLDKDKKKLLVRAFSETGAYQVLVHPSELRSRDPKSGEKDDIEHDSAHDTEVMITRVSSRASSNEAVSPKTVAKKGMFGYAVEWSDGARFNYSMKAIVKSANGKLVER